MSSWLYIYKILILVLLLYIFNTLFLVGFIIYTTLLSVNFQLKLYIKGFSSNLSNLIMINT